MIDTTPPVIFASIPLTAEATRATGATVGYNAVAVDDVDPSPVLSCVPASGSTFPLGTTTVTCNAHDAAGNQAIPKSFTITVRDTTPPTLHLPPDIVRTAQGPMAVTYTVTATDLVSNNPAVVCSPASGSTFPLGTTTVNCTATDAAGNQATGSFKITVAADTTPPVIAPHGPVAGPAASAAGNFVSYFNPSATDNVDATVTVTCIPASGSLFPIGQTTVTCTASDAAGNQAIPVTFVVTIRDVDPPTLHLPLDIIRTVSGPTAVSYTATATDFVPASPAVVCSPASGSTFPLGTTTVNCTATDAAGNQATGSFKITLAADTTPPVIAAHGPVLAQAAGAAGSFVSYFNPAATDNVDATVIVTCTPASGSLFPIGQTTITCTASDAAGNQATSVTFTLTVQDTTPPLIIVPATITVEASSAAGAAVSYTATAADTVGVQTFGCSPASGSTFPIGTTTVTCSATDTRNNTAVKTFDVKIQDTTGPAIEGTPADKVVEASSPGGAVVGYTNPTATDAVDGANPVSCSPESGSLFGIGTTTVSCTATDAAGNHSSTSFQVKVQDTTAPVINGVPADITVPATNANGAVVTYANPTANDLVDGHRTVTCVPSSGSTFPIATTAVLCSATDSRGNSATALFNVTVLPTAQADLELVATATPTSTWVGQPYTYTLFIRNAGPGAAVGAVLTDTLPLGVTVGPITTTAGSCSGASTITCALGTLPAGGSATVRIRVTAASGGVLSNSAGVASAATDPQAGNNSQTLQTSVAAPATLWAWGSNSFGALGDGSTTHRLSPVQAGGLANMVAAAAGTFHTVAVRGDGTVAASGSNAYGQLGDGTVTQRPSPVQVGGLANVVTVVAGSMYSVALRVDGTVWAWGHNAYGQLGDGTLTQRPSPVQVGGLANVVAVAAGYYHSIALRADGTVWAWGHNAYGQLGDGTLTQRPSPVQVGGLANVVAVVAGQYHSVAVRADGTVWAWGYNGSGQLGDGTVTDRLSPVHVVGLTRVVAVGSGANHSVAVRADGTVWAWGSNGLGQLGDGTVTQRPSPVQVGGLANVVTAGGAGVAHSVALRADGTVWSWGYNAYGQLGDGSTLMRVHPVRVLGIVGARALAPASAGYHTLALASGTLAPIGESASQAATAGGTVTTDAESDGATADDPLETSVTTPNAGPVTLTEAPTSTPASAYSFLGQQVQITAPAATATNPLVLRFRIDASQFSIGETSANIVVLRNGAPAPPCTGPAGQAAPNPCVSSRLTLADGDGQITVLTSAASLWTFAVPTGFGAHDQILALEAQIDTLPSLAGGQHEGLRAALLRKLQDADKNLTRAQQSLVNGKIKEAFENYSDALQSLNDFGRSVSNNTNRAGRSDKPISPSDASALIDAVTAIKALTLPNGTPAFAQIGALEAQIYLSPDLAASTQNGLRFDLADYLSEAEHQLLKAERSLALADASNAKASLQKAQERLSSFIQRVQRSTKDAGRPNNPVSQTSAASFIDAAQQAQAAIGALIR